MLWSDINSLIIMLVLLGWCFSLMRKNDALKRENNKLLEETGKYEDIKSEAKAILSTSTEVKTVKSIRERYGLSLVDAKKVVDSVK